MQNPPSMNHDIRFAVAAVAALVIVCCLPAASAQMFTDAERARLQDWWNQPGRYVMSSPDGAAAVGPWDVRLTPAASRWLRAYRGATGTSSLPPGRLERPSEGEMASWEEWVSAKIAYDRWQAQVDADGANAAFGAPSKAGVRPSAPGVIPGGLLQSAGNPPPFAAAVARQKWTVTFEDGEAFDYTTHIMLRDRFAYYRWDLGTVALGPLLRNMPEEEVDSLFAATGMTEFEQHVMRAISRLEGGFESVNTYDTGYVSIGFIQFITAAEGRGSLLEVLTSEKILEPADFARDFHDLGIDVDLSRTLVVVDPSSGAELSGADAVMKVIEDKRLAAVFQRAGRHSQAFRAAQIRVAKDHYWPEDDHFTIRVNGKTMSGRAGDVIRSEAGIAVLYDRKVNRGSISPFAAVLQELMEEKGLGSLEEVAPHERELVEKLVYRENFLKNPDLTKPD